jgi:hypothetical protein
MRKIISWRIYAHVYAHKAECGSADAGTFADTSYIPYLVTLLLLGLIFALVGFWRISASYATQRGAHIGAVAPAKGNDGWPEHGCHRAATESVSAGQHQHVYVQRDRLRPFPVID